MSSVGYRKIALSKAEKLIQKLSTAVIGTAVGDYSSLSSIQEKFSFDISSESLLQCYDSWKGNNEPAPQTGQNQNTCSRDSSLVIKTTDTLLTPNIFTSARLESPESASIISESSVTQLSNKYQLADYTAEKIPKEVKEEDIFGDLMVFIDNELKYSPDDYSETEPHTWYEDIIPLNIHRSSKEDNHDADIINSTFESLHLVEDGIDGEIEEEIEELNESEGSEEEEEEAEQEMVELEEMGQEVEEKIEKGELKEEKTLEDQASLLLFPIDKEIPDVPDRLLPMHPEILQRKKSYVSLIKPPPPPKPKPEKFYKNWKLPTERRESYIANSPICIQRPVGLNRKYIRKGVNTKYKWIQC